MPRIPQPPVLQQNDQIVVVAPAGPVEKADIKKGLSLISFPAQCSDAVFLKEGYFAGPQKTRRAEFQIALDTANAAAILCARGGFGSSQILDLLSFKKFVLAPKWLIGSSDITAILLHLWATYRIKSIHGPMAAKIANTASEDLKKLHKLLSQGFDEDPLSLAPLVNGTATGPLIGGNLTMVAHMIGTLKPNFAAGCILFLEDVAEIPYRLERCLIQLQRSGLLSQVSGVVLGEFTNCDAGAKGITAEQVLYRNLAPLNIPMATGYPAAHGDRNRPFIHGQTVELKVSSESAILTDLRL